MARNDGIGLALAATACLAAAPAHAPHRWQTYVNVRFGYSLCYPADVLHPGPEPDAHDGVIMRGPHGAQLAVGGDLGGASSSPQSVVSMDGAADRVTYHAQGTSWAVRSGVRPNGDLFYDRAQASGDQEANYSLTYPAADKALYASIIPRLNSCFKIVNLSY